MTDKTIKELIAEAQELGIDIHDHVAREMFESVDAKARHQAKMLTFCYLYGGTGRLSSPCPNPQSIPIREPNSKGPWKMTQEQIEAQSKIPREFKNTWMGEPFTHFDDCPAVDMPNYDRPPTTKRQQAEDRMHRVGVVPYKVEVFDDFGTLDIYTIHTTSALDARCMATIIAKGHPTNQWDDEQIELALACTKVVG